ncbi:MAG: hypothetical protein ACRD38_02520 [Nitrososphaerales archaeon]
MEPQPQPLGMGEAEALKHMLVNYGRGLRKSLVQFMPSTQFVIDRSSSKHVA